VTIHRTPNFNLPYPDGDEGPDIPRDIKALADAVDTLVASMFKVYWARGGVQNIAHALPHQTHNYTKFDQGSTGWSSTGLTVGATGLYLISGGVSMSGSGPNWCGATITAPGLSLGDLIPLRADGTGHSRSISFNSRPVQLNTGDKIAVTVRPVGTKSGNIRVNGASIYAVRLTPEVLISGTQTDGDVIPDE
jgi:hypothetical protein